MLELTISLLVLGLFDRLPAVDLRRSMLMLLAAACVATLPVRGDAQTLAAWETSATVGMRMIASQSYLIYTQPMQATKFNNYFFDAFGPYPIAVAAVTAGTGEDGHRVFSFPALVGPYAGSVVAVYVWYPNRYGAKDALRIGNYSLLEYMGGNIALEFLYMSPRSGLSRMHLNNRHGAPDPGSSQ